ncbi:MAG: flippase, partial [Oscillospiraceae bacterium]|nr:flippase [Oscillospiraceae bacterium]
ILVLIAPLITTPYVSRRLGSDGIGVYQFAQANATYFVLLAAVGTTLYGQREIAYVQNDPQKRTVLFWELTIFRFFTVGICTVLYTVVFGIYGPYSHIYRILILEILATAFDISWFFMGLENFRLTVLRNMIIKLVGIILVFTLVKTKEDVPLYTICLTLPILIGNISLWFSLPKYLVKLDHPVLKTIPRHFKPILILFIPQVATEVYLVLDKTMIGFITHDMDEVGYYSQAQTIVKICLMIVTSLGTVMLPAMSALFAKGDKEKIHSQLQLSFRFTFMLSAALLFGLCAVSGRFVPFFFGEGFEKVSPLIIIIAPILVIVGISNVIGKQYLLPTKQQTAYTLSVVCGAGCNFVLNIIFILFFQSIGASIATVLAELAVSLVQCWKVRKELPLGQFFRPLPKYLIMGAVMFVCVMLVGKVLPDKSWAMLVMVAVGIAVYVLELLVTKDNLVKIGYDMVQKKLSRRSGVQDDAN